MGCLLGRGRRAGASREAYRGARLQVGGSRERCTSPARSLARVSAAKPRRRSRVPSGRVERLARLGLLAAELAGGGIYEGARRVLGGGAAAGASALLSPANAQRLTRRLSQLRGA